MRKLFIILLKLILVIIISIYCFKYYCLKHQPVYMQYPKLPKTVEQGIRFIDKFITFTANIVWYEATEIATGKKYIVNLVYGKKIGIYIRLKDDDNAEWKLISTEDYLHRFNNGQEIGLKFIKFFRDDNRGNFKKGYMYYEVANYD